MSVKKISTSGFYPNRMSRNKDRLEGSRIHLSGRVQGVGMRPAVFNMANKLHIYGIVYNQPDGVIIETSNSEKQVREFISCIRSNAPHAAIIKNIRISPIETDAFEDFRILQSIDKESAITEVCPDISVCDDCLEELSREGRRNSYPFNNCTNCGPRFTIIDKFPYDRANTSMKEFVMCRDCDHEYHDPANRRFHAQPVSCSQCGPEYKYILTGCTITGFHEILPVLCSKIDLGEVVAIKGLGGYVLCCDASDQDAVSQIRSFKKRDNKPFAVMFRSVGTLEKYALINDKEKDVLSSWIKPILILPLHDSSRLAGVITSGLHTIGALLPYLPLHFLMFSQLKADALVYTSGNESDTPILFEDNIANDSFRNLKGGILSYNRKIVRRIDDSVVRVIAGQPQIMRRARGYVPAPIDVGFRAEGILATGAELANAFCIGKGNQAILSQHIGDLKNADTYNFFCSNIASFRDLYHFTPEKIACDLHPDYLSTRYAQDSKLPVIRIQHHHAHIASVMAEHNIKNKVIGLSYDGTGLGTDGQIWGSELLIADYTTFERVSHYNYVAIPGGDLCISEPWRSALAYLYDAYGDKWMEPDIPFMKVIDKSKAEKLVDAIKKGINSPQYCSAGRLFDAIAAMLNLCFESHYHAEAPLILENYIDERITGCYAFEGNEIIDFRDMIQEIVSDILNKKNAAEIVTKFHNTIASAACHQVIMATKATGIQQVILSGGTFQNKCLTEKILFLLNNVPVEVFLPQEVPANDGGLALGQLAIAAHS